MLDFLIDNWLWLVGCLLVLMFFGRRTPKKATKSKILVQDYIPNGPVDKKSAEAVIKRFASDLGSGSKGERHYLETLEAICSGELAVIKSERDNAEIETKNIEEHKQAQLKELQNEKTKYDLSDEEFKDGAKEIESIARDEMKAVKRLLTWCNKQENEIKTDVKKPLKFVLNEAKRNWNEGGWDTYFHFSAEDYPSIQEKVPN